MAISKLESKLGSMHVACLYIELHGSFKSTQNMKIFPLKTTLIHPNQR